LKLLVDETQTRKHSIDSQLRNETQYLASRNKVDAYRERITTLQSQLDSLRLQYTETYPDIVSLKDQILELELAIESTQQGSQPVVGSSNNPVENPLWDDL